MMTMMMMMMTMMMRNRIPNPAASAVVAYKPMTHMIFQASKGKAMTRIFILLKSLNIWMIDIVREWIDFTLNTFKHDQHRSVCL